MVGVGLSVHVVEQAHLPYNVNSEDSKQAELLSSVDAKRAAASAEQAASAQAYSAGSLG